MNISNPRQTPTESWSTPTFQQGLSQLGLTLSDYQFRQFQLYQRELESWNQRFNLTRITGPEQVQTLHFLDSLTVVQALSSEVKTGGHIIDIGAGAGFPGLPLKIAFPGLRLTLMDSVGKKIAFLRHLIDILDLSDVQLLQNRAETAGQDPQFRETFDVALARGLAPLPVLAELSLPFCKVGGVLVAHKKGDVAQELEGAQNALAVLGARPARLQSVGVVGLEDDRVLVIAEKASPTPARFPRRPGIPKRRPL